MMRIDPSSRSDSRREVRLFVSWAHADALLAESLLGRVEPRLRIAAGQRFVVWRDSDLHLGDVWFAKIMARLGSCDAGVQLLSPEFFGSDFIVRHEITPFVGPGAAAIALPVGLVYLPFDGSMQMHGVSTRQAFTLDGRWYNQLTSNQQRDRFAAALAGKIIEAVQDPDEDWAAR